MSMALMENGARDTAGMASEVCVGSCTDSGGQLTTEPLHSQDRRRTPSQPLDDASQGRRERRGKKELE